MNTEISFPHLITVSFNPAEPQHLHLPSLNTCSPVLAGSVDAPAAVGCVRLRETVLAAPGTTQPLDAAATPDCSSWTPLSDKQRMSHVGTHPLTNISTTSVFRGKEEMVEEGEGRGGEERGGEGRGRASAGPETSCVNRAVST